MNRPASIFLLFALAVSGAPTLASAQHMSNDPAICEEARKTFDAMDNKATLADGKTVILLYKEQFCPQHLTVKAGTELRWINIEKRTSHSVWFKDDGRQESQRAFPDETIDMKIDLAPGEHRYLCGPHWENGMIGTLTVE